ncbi:MAG: peptidylprolyl isomerase [Alphaproteobacteria bacterium]|jgi:peptidyl-prolyl cis-trans isomerase SurA|nr:peptidylprolyl isomerase [Alphaproteobacteria bacterium]MBU2043060.1 peptidylprolyl isomerase [Alphaproteobacteria bacterium]MBU2126258.1 peptidylprolyl isomerase [Alphaproteobacteria bacterium]MBU2207816.1 peptidylprolyl isomerase [Alphaproteobacteria bacterium]MBU2291195.1 peptidylprolyl isomerase [Alphaproteobacteria bacterium]
MGLQRYMTGVAIAALLAGSAMAQTAPPAQPAAAGNLNPAAEAAPAPAPAAPAFQMSDGILATVNDSVITGFDLRQRMLLVIAMTQVQPTPESIPAIQQQALNALVDERLQIQELANYEDLVVSDEEVAEEITAMAQEVGATPQAYVDFLAQGGIRPSTLNEQIRTQIGWSRLVGGRFQSRARVSRAAVTAAIRQASEAAAKKQYLIGEIYIESARVGGQQAALNGANQLVQQMVQGAPFQAVAQQFSAAPSATRGGDAGWVVEGTVQPALQQALDQLDVGQLSRPIPVEGGVYIIYMRDKRDGASASLVQIKQVMIELPETATEADVTAATQRLETLRPQLTCDTMLARATSEQGLLGADLGEADVQNLAPQFQQVARSAEVGSVSTPVRTPLGLHLLAVCGRRMGGTEAPNPQEVENQLFRQNLATLGRRYMRDLREDALIEYR